MKITTAQQLVEFTAEQIRLHYGPGPHSDGTPQSVHGGGEGQRAGHEALKQRTEFQKRPWQVGSGHFEPKDAPQPTRGRPTRPWPRLKPGHTVTARGKTWEILEVDESVPNLRVWAVNVKNREEDAMLLPSEVKVTSTTKAKKIKPRKPKPEIPDLVDYLNKGLTDAQIEESLRRG